MKTGVWIAITVVVLLVSFWGGYTISADTGTEPGYFEAVEAAGYGGGTEAVEGISEDMMQYYKDLQGK